MLSKDLEWASVSIGALLLGNMEGSSFHRVFEINRYIKRDVKIISIGVTLGNLEVVTDVEGVPSRGLPLHSLAIGTLVYLMFFPTL
jgi:hypothetical protein